MRIRTRPAAKSAKCGIENMCKVIGLAGKDWLQIKLKDGTVGFIPTSAAE